MACINDHEIILVGGGGIYKPYDGILIIYNYEKGEVSL